jgi:hypothetical protein
LARALSTQWTRNIKDPKKREDFERTLRASNTLVIRLLEILDEEERALNTGECSLKDFEDPSWAYKQAFKNGDRQRIKKLRDLLSFVTNQGKE